MSKIVFVETISTFRHTYAIRLPDNEPNEYALDDITDAITKGSYEDKLSDMSQNHISEDIFSHRVITEEEYLEIFDSVKHRNKEYDFGAPVGKEVW